MHGPLSFSVCQQVIDRTVLVSDNEMCQAMAWAADELKLALEPAGAAVLAALNGPLQKDKTIDPLPLSCVEATSISKPGPSTFPEEENPDPF